MDGSDRDAAPSLDEMLLRGPMPWTLVSPRRSRSSSSRVLISFLACLARASGGAYALMLAHLPTIILNWRSMKTVLEWAIR